MKKILALAFASLLACSAHAACRTPYFQKMSTQVHVADAVAAANLNGDGKPDAITSTATSISVALNDGTGKLPAPVLVYSGNVSSDGVVTGDFDGNNKVDLAFATPNGFTILPGIGGVAFGNAITTAATLTKPRIAAARFDAGNTLDLVVIDQAAPVLLLLTNAGNGTLTEKARVTLRSNPSGVTTADFDADGSMDVLVSYSSGTTLDVFYGNGSGTFTVSAVQAVEAIASMRGADFNEDGLPDIVVSTHRVSVVLFRNLGSRTFGDPLTYRTEGSSVSLDVAELTGDAYPDIFMAPRVSSCAYKALVSSGLVTFSNSWIFRGRYLCPNYYPVGSVALGDFDGDGRNDALVSSRLQFEDSTLTVYRNLCGDGQVLLRTNAPLVSTNQAAKLTVEVGGPDVEEYAAFSYYAGTGTVTLREGELVRGTATLDENGRATFALSGLSVGEHTFTASHEGDAQYTPRTSAPLKVRVTPETTTTTLTLNPTTGAYGISSTLKVTVTSSDGTPAGGNVRLFKDGKLFQTLTPPYTTSFSAEIGTYLLQAEYDGDATHPASSSSVVNYVVSKQTPALSLSPPTATAGQARSIEVRLSAQYYGYPPKGTVTLSEAGTSYGTQALSFNSATFQLPAMAAGTHHLKVVYSGEERFTSVETTLPLFVFPPETAVLEARGASGQIHVSWSGDSWRAVKRKLPSQPWENAITASCCSAWWSDTTAARETVYQYRADFSGTTLIDIGMRIAFTDDPALAGTKIKAIHIQELVRATNIVRSAAALAPLSLNITPGMPVSAAHITTLRNAIQQARVALGAYAFPFNEAIAPGFAIRATHVQELREAIR